MIFLESYNTWVTLCDILNRDSQRVLESLLDLNKFQIKNADTKIL